MLVQLLTTASRQPRRHFYVTLFTLGLSGATLNYVMLPRAAWALVLFCKISIHKFVSIKKKTGLLHPAGRALTSHWSVNSFTMVVFFSLALDRKFGLKKNILIDNHYKPISGGAQRGRSHVNYKLD